MQKYKPLAYLVILGALAGLVLAGWLIGHVLRYSSPEIWHPPLPEMEPGIMTGFEYEGVRRLVHLPENAGIRDSEWVGQARVRFVRGPLDPGTDCISYTYFTSLPAKCLTADGRLVRVGGTESTLITIPPE
jgi:hypothetical protein